jgi:NADPH2:quinone reductase
VSENEFKEKISVYAVRVHEIGAAEALTYEDIPQPEPGAGEARVKIDAIGVNFVDIYQRKGLYPLTPPFIPGSEAAGVVDAVGEGVTDLKPGDRVAYAMVNGAYAEQTIVPATRLVKLPDDMDANLAAAVILQGTTAHFLTIDTFPLNSSHTALVHAAAGGVGLLLVQMAKKRGASVIGTVSTEEKAALAKEAGADEIILYTEADFEAETKRLTQNAGVDVVYDSVGATTFDKSLKCLKPRGFMILYGQSSGPVPPVDPLRLNWGGSLYLTRPGLANYLRTREELEMRCKDIFAMIADGRLKVRVDTTFTLAEAQDAHRYMEARKTKGKVLLLP